MHIKHIDGSFEYVPYFCLPGEAAAGTVRKGGSWAGRALRPGLTRDSRDKKERSGTRTGAGYRWRCA